MRPKPSVHPPKHRTTNALNPLDPILLTPVGRKAQVKILPLQETVHELEQLKHELVLPQVVAHFEYDAVSLWGGGQCCCSCTAATVPADCCHTRIDYYNR